MIIDRINELGRYTSICQILNNVAELVKNLDLESITTGRYEIPLSDAFYYCFEYETKESEHCKGEIHSRMIDVHFIITGSEIIGTCNRSVADLSPYDAENDYSMAVATFEHYTISAGSFALLLPHEAHVTGIKAGNTPMAVKKLVFKIPLE